MMILGEMSANPEGIYGPGQWNESLRLKLDPNWYGTNTLVTWDYDTGVVGYGTMCPRISTTAIKFDNLTCNSPGNYSIVFYDIMESPPKVSLRIYDNTNSYNIYNIETDAKIVNEITAILDGYK
jgi:hypothetical protein